MKLLLPFLFLTTTTSAWNIAFYSNRSNRTDYIIHSGVGKSGCIEFGVPGLNNQCVTYSEGGEFQKDCGTDGPSFTPEEFSLDEHSFCSVINGTGNGQEYTARGQGGERNGQETVCVGGFQIGVQ
ncbi:MAG: hypothetical protein Q9210_006735, partial [Variospora velana]